MSVSEAAKELDQALGSSPKAEEGKGDENKASEASGKKPDDVNLDNTANRQSQPVEPKTEQETKKTVLAKDPLAKESKTNPAEKVSSSSIASEKQTDPTPVNDLLRKGIAAHNAGNDAEAERIFRDVIAKSPFNPNAYYNLGAIAESKGDLAAALGDYRTALIGHPGDQELQAAVAQVEDQIVRKQAGAFQNPVVYQGSGKTVLRGNAADFGVKGNINGGGAYYAGTANPSSANFVAPPYRNPYAGQVGQQAPPPSAPQQAQAGRGKFAGAATEFAFSAARIGASAAMGRGFSAGSVVNAFHCPICRLLH